MAEFLRTQAAWRLARAGSDPVRAARCAAALLDAAAFVVTLAGDDKDLAALARAGCFGGDVFDPGAPACRSRAGGNSVIRPTQALATCWRRWPLRRAAR